MVNRYVHRKPHRNELKTSPQASSTPGRTFNDHPQVFQIDASLVIMMLQVAIQLWQLWKANNVSEPSVVTTSEELEMLGESFYDEGDDE